MVDGKLTSFDVDTRWETEKLEKLSG